MHTHGIMTHEHATFSRTLNAHAQARSHAYTSKHTKATTQDANMNTVLLRQASSRQFGHLNKALHKSRDVAKPVQCFLRATARSLHPQM